MEIEPSKKLGQNFLTNRGVIEKIIGSAELKPEDVVLEIGPGLGALTEKLAEKAKRVIAVEKDTRLADILKERFKDASNIEIINGDILKITSEPVSGGYKVVANLPFNIAAAVIQKFLEAKNRPEDMTVLIQKEVAQRICAKPPKMSVLAVSVQIYAQPKILFYISKGSFRPSPKVDAACVKLSLTQRKPENGFFNIVKAGFAHPRKQLGSNLPKSQLLKAGIDPARRAETLSVEEWMVLHRLSREDI